jgi:hypothetical protein
LCSKKINPFYNNLPPGFKSFKKKKMKKEVSSYITLIYGLLLVAIILACNKKSQEIGPSPNAVKIGTKYLEPADSGTITNVTKQANTSEVPLAVMTNFIKEEANKMYFKANATEVKDLKTGNVVLFEGYALRKISSISEKDGQIIVATTKAKFGEYYKTAKINYVQKMKWTASNVRNAKVAIGGRLSAVTVNAKTNDLEFTGEVSGWKITLKITPEPGGAGRKLNMELSAEKEGKAKIKTKGFISDFEADSQIEVNAGRVTTMGQHNRNLNGEMDVKYTFLTMREALTFEIPLEFEQTILVSGVIPVTFKLKCVLKVFPEVASNSTTQAHLKVTYAGNQGFNFTNGNLVPDGILSQFNSQVIGETGSASSGIIGVGVGFEFPRLSVGVFGELVAPYIVHNTSVINYFESGLPFVPGPCNQTKLKIKGEMGVDLRFLGATISQSVDLYEREFKMEKEGSKCPGSSNARRAEAIAYLGLGCD